MPRYPGMPLLSIVVAAHNTEEYLVAALASLRDQQWPNIEVIVVDDGSTDSTDALATEFVAQDSRFRLVKQENAGPGAARNNGAAQARGKYIAFFDSDDLADPFFYRQAVLGLERSGSDFAVGGYDVLIGGKKKLPPRYIRELHRRSRRRTTLASLPEVMTNALICTRVFRREFYTRAVAPQPEGVFFEDQILAMRAFVRAVSFDLLHQPALQWRRRASRESTTQRAGEADNLRQRIQAYRQVADFLVDEGLTEVRRERLAQILATDQLTLAQLTVATQEYFDVARDFLDWAIAEVGEDRYTHTVDCQDRVLQALVRRADLATAQSFLLAEGRDLAQWVFRPARPSPEPPSIETIQCGVVTDDEATRPKADGGTTPQTPTHSPHTHFPPTAEGGVAPWAVHLAATESGVGGLLGWLPRWPLDQQIDLPTADRRPTDRQRSLIQPAAILDEAAWRAATRPDAPAAESGAREMALRCWYWKAPRRLRRQIYLQCLDGDHATDTQLALANELARRDLAQVVWGVKGNDRYVPEGQAKVVIGTADYYDALANSRVLCFNHDLPGHLVSHPGQTVIQTFHGHPFKAMGIPWWHHLGQNPAQIRLNLERRQRWDVLLSPSPLASRLYGECFPVRAEVWEIGAPRNDLLARPPAGPRYQVRARLGIRPDQVAVLYAPTYRDYATTDPWHAPLVGIADPGRLARRLGRQYQVLLRGHPSNRHVRQGRFPGVIDVTGYKQINELLLASDIGLFDYSSVRFDYTLTGKPMAYHTPDQQLYFESHPALWPYEDTLAGPRTTEESDLPEAINAALSNREQWAPSRQALQALVAPQDDGRSAARLAARISELA